MDFPIKIAQCYRVDINKSLLKEESQLDIPINHSISTLNKGICRKVEYGKVTNMWDLGDILWGGTIQVFHYQALKVRTRPELKHDLEGEIKGQQEYKALVFLNSPG